MAASKGALLALLLSACTPASAGPAFTGIARAIDGDSLHVSDREVRLFGIDAPEWDQSCQRGGKDWACGQDAADQLAKLVTGKDVICQTVDTDEHGRTVARCRVNGVDVNRAMVASGYATAYRQYSLDYVPAEESAKAKKIGLWSSNFQLPSEYRHSEPQQAKRQARRRGPAASSARSAPAPASGCVIKGNQGSNGWIYHVPGMPFYERTKAEQMFCSEAEAEAAGYRRAKVR